MSRFAYNLFLHTLVAPFLLAYYAPRIIFRGKYRRSIRGKLGRLPTEIPFETLPRPRLWFHAVSVGEVVALAPLTEAMKEAAPGASVIVSTGTETGQDKAREMIHLADAFLYLPLDFPSCLNPVVERIDPDLFVLMETELWPNLIASLKRRGTVIALANGRISDRSFPRYRTFRGFFAPILRGIDLFLMTSELDARRIGEMGAPQERIFVTGNTKFDAAVGKVPWEAEGEMRELLDLGPDAQVLVAGSTHPGENEIVLDAYQKLRQRFPRLLLILVPRHVEKTPQIVSLMRERNMEPPYLRSSADSGEKRDGKRVVIVDRTGELFRVYSVASVVFMGGSLVHRGGQNILEPAAWGKVVLFGPSMEDFRDARDILIRTGCGTEVRNAEELTSRITGHLADPIEAHRLGQLGREEVLRHMGSSRKNAQMLGELLASEAGSSLGTMRSHSGPAR
jgi:3-deoxy-D-manno-octulosonic-acid transferase